MTNYVLGIPLQRQSKIKVLEKIKEYSKISNYKFQIPNSKQQNFLHIVSLNPENLIIAESNVKFKNVVTAAQIRIIDGVGVVIAARFLGTKGLERVTGVELMAELIELARQESLKVLLIGGKKNLAEELAHCYKKKYPDLQLMATEGIKDIKNIKKFEEDKIFSIVSHNRPHLIFAAFGSPEQELWFEANSSKLRGVVCMGVGGAFEYLAGRVPRAPLWARKFGLEWLFRLINQPWRWRRQTRILQFIWLVLKEKFS